MQSSALSPYLQNVDTPNGFKLGKGVKRIKQARKLQDAQAVKLTSLKVDKLKSQPADKIAIIRISCRTRDATLRGVSSQLDIGERDAKDAEDKYPNTVLNFNGDLKYSKWGPQIFKMGTSNIQNGDL